MPHREYQSVVNKLAEARAEVEQYKAQLSTALNECLDTVLRENSLIVALRKVESERDALKLELDQAYEDRADAWTQKNATMQMLSRVENELDRLRAVINSHAQSGCNCQFCKDARELAESEKE